MLWVPFVQGTLLGFGFGLATASAHCKWDIGWWVGGTLGLSMWFATPIFKQLAREERISNQRHGDRWHGS